MAATQVTSVLLARRPNGPVVEEDFRIATSALPRCPAGGMLLETRYLSLDPYMRGRMDDRKSYVPPVAIGDIMSGEVVARVAESDHPDFDEGEFVLARSGWATHAASDGKGVKKVTGIDGDHLSLALGVLGMPGFTAYAGLQVIGQPKSGETLVVAAATGPVGSLVGQLARLAGLRAVAIAGGAEKCAYAVETFGFDAAVDHKSPSFSADLAAACPKGIDIYFENVGGAVWQAVLPLLNKFARVPLCGLIAEYDQTMIGDRDLLPATMREILTRSLTIRGFINYDLAEWHYPNFLRDVGQGIANGSILYREDVSEGIEAAPSAFIRMMTGANFGKALVRME